MKRVGASWNRGWRPIRPSQRATQATQPASDTHTPSSCRQCAAHVGACRHVCTGLERDGGEVCRCTVPRTPTADALAVVCATPRLGGGREKQTGLCSHESASTRRRPAGWLVSWPSRVWGVQDAEGDSRHHSARVENPRRIGGKMTTSGGPVRACGGPAQAVGDSPCRAGCVSSPGSSSAGDPRLPHRCITPRVSLHAWT